MDHKTVTIPQLHAKLKHLFLETKGKLLEDGPTKLSLAMGLGKSYLSQHKRDAREDLPQPIEQFLVLRFGFGPTDQELDEAEEAAWSNWEGSRPAWRRGDAGQFCQELAARRYRPRPVEHPRIQRLLAQIGRSVASLKAFESNGILVTDEERAELIRAFTWMVNRSVKPRATGVPTPSHLMQVCGIVLENHGTLKEAVAALLHDAVEDYPNTLPDIRAEFGPEVAAIVLQCSDGEKTDAEEREKWFSRKTAYLRKIKSASPSAFNVIVADKLHNARAMYRDARSEGRRLWRTLDRSPEETVAYFIVAHEILRARHPSAATNELGMAVALLASSFCKDRLLSKEVIRFQVEVNKSS